jgi:hypothetical protein
LASVLNKKIQPAFKKIGITGVGWHTFRHTPPGHPACREPCSHRLPHGRHQSVAQ